MDYRQAIEFLYSLRLFGTKLGLENTRALATLSGNPEHALHFIHVAGTNGKGSVCAMLEAIYRQAGLRVGLFTSPHLISFTERIQVNRAPIPEATVSRLVGTLQTQLGISAEAWPFRPTFFECVTILALLHFREQNCDLVVWETGMGGRLDATNIVEPLATVITNVQLDHQSWLGETLPLIAREKAGIIKPRVPLITAATGEALEVIRKTAKESGAPLTIVRPQAVETISPQKLSLTGEHQQVNAAVVLATVEALQSAIPIDPAAIQAGLANTVWPGRLQRLRIGSTTLFLDGAHNPAGAEALASSLKPLSPPEGMTLIFGVFADKSWKEMCGILIPLFTRIFFVPILSDRTAHPEQIRDFCASQWPSLDYRIANSSAAAVQEALKYSFVVVAGSLHLVGEVMESLGLSSAKCSERQLNEWNASNSLNPPFR